MAAAAALSLVAAGCSSSSNSSSSTPTTSAAAPVATSSAVASTSSAASASSASAATSTAAPGSGLKTIDQSALQALVDSSIKEQLIPGAVVVLSTPQGDFTVASGTTELGVQSPPDADTHFRIASNTKTMTSAVVLQ